MSRERRGLSLRSLGQLAHRSKSHIHKLEAGLEAPTVDTARHLDRIPDAGGVLARLVDAPIDHAVEAGELRARVAATDVSNALLERIEQGVDDLASSYPTMAPADLLPLARRHLSYVVRLLH
ncbi:hypothetical protein BAW75_03905 [Micromonospora chalcea]|nr:hypothetical protein BAW75_03905 [Micromonospora chalcea]